MSKGTRPVVTVDWAELRQKLDAVGASLSETMQATPTQAARVLQERAARLRQVPKALAARRETSEALAFLRAGERYAIDLPLLHSVQPFTAPAPIPGAPPFVWGMVNVRGDIVAVIDLTTYVEGAGLPRASRPEHLVVASLQVRADERGGDQAFVALPADGIAGIVPVEASAVLPPIHTFSDRKRRLLRGLLPDGTLLLDLGDTFAAAAREADG